MESSVLGCLSFPIIIQQCKLCWWNQNKFLMQYISRSFQSCFKIMLDWDHFLVSALTLRISWRISIASAITELSKMNEFLVNSLPLRLFWKCSSVFASSLPCEIKAQPDILQRIFWDFSPSDCIPLSLSLPDTSFSIKGGFEFVKEGEFRRVGFCASVSINNFWMVNYLVTKDCSLLFWFSPDVF